MLALRERSPAMSGLLRYTPHGKSDMQLAELEYALEDSIPTQRVLHLRIGLSDVRLAIDRAAAKLQRKTRRQVSVKARHRCS
jgi:hypothetical protein